MLARDINPQITTALETDFIKTGPSVNMAVDKVAL